jgi:prepilin-type processing-associated H-X9-DG protein
MGCSMVAYWGVNNRTPDSNGQHGAQWFNFASNHTGIANFAWGDGSVRPINKGVVTETSAFANASWYHLQELAGFTDGYADDCSDLTN